VRRELESERAGLEHAATTLKTQSGNVAKRFAITAAAAVAVAVAVKVVASRVFAHEEPEKEGRARFPFHGKD
jgi:hypothetical protein